MKKLIKIGLWSLILAAVAAVITYLLRGKIWQKWLNLTPPQFRVTVEKGLMVRMRDGVFLATDHYAPATGEPVPTILIRTPYGRGGRVGLITRFYGQRFAERGYHVVIQDVRGRFDSEGRPFEPFIHEAQDGIDTVEWLKTKPWFNGQIGLWGASYLGYVQWALVSQNVPEVQALVPITTQSNLGASAQRSMLLDNILRWMLILDAQMNESVSTWERLKRTGNAAYQEQLMAQAAVHLPLREADQVMLNDPMPFFQTWNEHPERDDPYWEAINHNGRVSQVTAPVYSIAGWYDIFLKGQLEDYERLKAAGQTPYLLIGPWTHLDQAVLFGTVRQGLHWFETQLKGQPSDLQPRPVRIGVMNGGGVDSVAWRDYEVWPPASQPHSFYLQPEGQLSVADPAAAEASPSRYTYDPADPTPNLGGPLLATSAGPVDNRPLEAREDVLLFTTPPLTEEVEVIGYVKLELYVQSSTLHTDFFGRLCDVQPDGRSLNVCDGLLRLEPQEWEAAEDGVLCIEVPLSATAYRFVVGHRIRLQVSSGAHPRFSRNLGTGEPIAHGERLVTAEQTVFHDGQRPSRLMLPVVNS